MKTIRVNKKENVKLSFLEFVTKFFPDHIESEHHKKLIEKISKELIKAPHKTVIVYDGKANITEKLLHNYLHESMQLAIKKAKQNGN